MILRSNLLLSLCSSSLKYLPLPRILQKLQRQYSILKPSFVTDLSFDLDIDRIKEEHKQLSSSGNSVNLQDLVKDALELKCSETIKKFSGKTSKMVAVIKQEHSFLFAEGNDIPPPDEMTNKQWLEAMTLSSMDERLEFYKEIECDKQTERLSQEEAGPLREDGDGHPYSMHHVQHTHPMLRSNDYRLSTAMRHGVPLVFDMGLEHHMTHSQVVQAAKQLWMAHQTNMDCPQPFHFIFTSCHKKSVLLRTLELNHSLQNHHFLVSETEESFLEKFPPSEYELVYLSPYANKVIRSFNPNTVYILGAYSESRYPKKHDLAKAKEQKIECRRFPIDNYIKWIKGNKNFPLQAVVKVLQDVRGGTEWKDAFARSLPSKNFSQHPDSTQIIDLDEVMREESKGPSNVTKLK